jgi:peptide/nickel transport system substrate-binding protein
MRASGVPGRLVKSLAISFASFGIALMLAVAPAAAQKKGGTLRLYHNDNPPSTSLLEESTIASVMPFAAVFNNLARWSTTPHAR